MHMMNGSLFPFLNSDKITNQLFLSAAENMNVVQVIVNMASLTVAEMQCNIGYGGIILLYSLYSLKWHTKSYAKTSSQKKHLFL
jgi:hypothetical protein